MHESYSPESSVNFTPTPTTLSYTCSGFRTVRISKGKNWRCRYIALQTLNDGLTCFDVAPLPCSSLIYINLQPIICTTILHYTQLLHVSAVYADHLQGLLPAEGQNIRLKYKKGVQIFGSTFEYIVKKVVNNQ